MSSSTTKTKATTNTNSNSNTNNVSYSQVNGGSWDSLNPGLTSTTLKTIDRLGFKNMSPVQSAAIPCFLMNKDVLVQACTGSGKTLAFLIPIIEMILKKNKQLQKNEVASIILSPTRELATQIYQILQEFLIDLKPKKEEDQEDQEGNNNEEKEKDKQVVVKVEEKVEEEEEFYIDISSILLIGGTEIYQDIQNFKNFGGNIMVGTPGRIDEFLQRIETSESIKYREFEVLILDEADRLVDMGFHLAINSILAKLPKQRRTGLFSATQTYEIKELARTGMRNPVDISVTEHDLDTMEVQSVPSTLNNRYMICPVEEKLNQLVQFLVDHVSNSKLIIYFLTCSEVDYYYKVLKSINSLKSAPIFSLHGKAPHQKRQKIFEQFTKQTEFGALLSTDLASRGLDIPNVDWVVQFDSPQDPKAFVHRIGRTARMGRDGNALVFLAPEEDTYINFLKIKKVPLLETPKIESPPDIMAQVKKAAQQDRDLMEKSIVAFVSHVRAYKEHLCPFIFVFHKLDIGKLATGFGLLYLPRMPELKDVNLEWSSGLTPEDIEKIPYLEKKKEKERQLKLQKDKKKKQDKLLKKSKIEELKKQHKEQTQKQIEENEKKRKFEQLEKEKKSTTINGSKVLTEEELKDHQENTKSLKKQKKKRKSKNSMFDDLVEDQDDEDDDEDESD
eukprot:gene7792-9591_t